MANDRLYIVDSETKEYCCIAKCFGIEWQMINAEIVEDFLRDTLTGKKSNLVIGLESDDEFYPEHIQKGTNRNLNHTWIVREYGANESC